MASIESKKIAESVTSNTGTIQEIPETVDTEVDQDLSPELD